MQLSREHTVSKRPLDNAEQAKVLVVDDNASFLAVIAEFLRNSGYFVLPANTSDLGLQLLHQTTPDLIISDVMMPGIDGHELYDIVRQSPEWCEIPFLYLTALSDPNDIRRGKERGCDDYLIKPFNPEELLSVIRGKLSTAKKRKTLNEEKMDVYRRRIIHTLSHEFRTPLVAINTGTELLLDQHQQLETDRVKNLLESVYRGGQRLQRLVNDFMTLQQIDSGRAAITHQNHCRVCSLGVIAESAIEYFQSTLGETKAPIELLIPPGAESSANVFVHDIQVVEIVSRLLSNAHKFGSEKPISVSISIDENRAAIHVRDQGPGLAAEMFEKAIQTFTQINREKLEQQGAGLGLTIANYYTELNGGALSFQNPDGGGVEAIIAFDRAKE